MTPDFDPTSLGVAARVRCDTRANPHGQMMTEFVAVFVDGSQLVARGAPGHVVTLDVQPAPRFGVLVRPATDAEQRAAIIRTAQQDIHDGTATHDCGDWRHGLICELCGQWLG